VTLDDGFRHLLERLRASGSHSISSDADCYDIPSRYHSKGRFNVSEKRSRNG
jgi:hypothetical protein